MATAKRVVAERFREEQMDKPDMLGSFVSHGLSQQEAEAESLVQIIAGSDTTASALRTIMADVMTNLDVYRRLQSEIDQGIADGRISTPITDAEARKLPYLEGCIKEGLRIWPPITGVMPRISDQDATVCGVHVPAGTNVAWSAHAALRDKEVFGADADFYRPDRWIRATEEEYRLMDNSVDLCFGSGRWGCLGRPIAMIELNKMVPELLRRFDFAALNTAQPIVNKFYGVLIQQDLIVQITKRA
jgi:cytochrome P450